MDKKQLADFITDNKIIGITSGFIIGFVSKDLILSFVKDLIIPIIIILLMKLKIKLLSNILPHKDNGLNVIQFINSLITWILALISTYLFVKYAFIELIGAKNIIKN